MLLYDMRLNDKYVYDKLLGAFTSGEPINISELAIELGTHRNTLSRILKRLRSAGMIEKVGGSDRYGYVYRLKEGDHSGTRARRA